MFKAELINDLGDVHKEADPGLCKLLWVLKIGQINHIFCTSEIPSNMSRI